MAVHPRRKHKKRAPDSFRSESALSSDLRGARDLVQRTEFASGLKLLNSIATRGDDDAIFKALGLVGDSEFKRGRFAKAIQIYQRLRQMPERHPRLWLRPLFGRLRALLKMAEVGQASALAREASGQAEHLEARFRDQIRDWNRSVRPGQQLRVVQRPARASVVITRMGHIFLSEGELEIARELFERVVAINPKGGTRARLGLAEIALRSENLAAAAAWAFDGLVKGKFQAKTLSAWPILITARRQQGLVGVDPSVLELVVSARTTVSDRAIGLVITSLRKFNDPAWRQLAERWLQDRGDQAPAMAAELRKRILASLEASSASVEEIAQAADELLNTPLLAPHEWLSAAKRLIRLSAPGEISGKVALLTQSAGQRFGPDRSAYVLHGLALACLLRQQQTLGRNLLQRALQISEPGTRGWGRSLWALAKAEQEAGDYITAASRFRTFFDNESMPQRLRYFALAQWSRCVSEGGNTQLLSQAAPLLHDALRKISDYDVLLDIARQLIHSPLSPQDEGLPEAFRSKGESLAMKVITTAEHPAVVVTALFKLARRQNDFGAFHDTIKLWEQQAAPRRDWLWSRKQEFWEFLAYVIRAFGWTAHLPEAESLAMQYANDASTPPEGVSIIAVSHGLVRAFHNDIPGALEVFDAVVARSPKHELSAYAYYWIALRARKRGDRATELRNLTALREALGNPSRLGWKVDLALNASWLQADLVESQLHLSGIACTDEQIKRALVSLRNDLARL